MKDRPFIDITWQDGPRLEVGLNGANPEDVLLVVKERLQELNVPPHDTRENALAITKIQEAIHWLMERTRDREARGVEGTSRI